jgi:hypothetical protein
MNVRPVIGEPPKSYQVHIDVGFQGLRGFRYVGFNVGLLTWIRGPVLTAVLALPYST